MARERVMKLMNFYFGRTVLIKHFCFWSMSKCEQD